MQTAVRRIILGFGILAVGIFIYWATVVVQARAQTPAIVSRALSPENTPLSLADLSNRQIGALLSIQDPNFYHHQGFDVWTPGAGITTLSQGLVKIFYFDSFQPGLAKIKQTLIARFAFDPMTPKDTILTLFVNHVYLGQRDGKPIYGFADGADYYFDKKFQDLSWDEYLGLVAMIRAPFTFHYFNKRAANDLRVARIQKMLSGEYVPQDNSDWLYDR